MKQRNILRHHADRFAQALLGNAGDVLAIDQDAAVLHVVKTLQQREQCRLAAAGTADQPDPFARREAQIEVLENLLSVAIAEINVLELDAGAAADERRRLGMVAQFVRHQQRRQRLRQARDMLGDVDQRHREIARRVQHRDSQRADQHDVAGRGGAALPEHDRPGEQAERQHDGHHGVKDAEFFEIEQAAPPRLHFALDGRVETAMLAQEAAERPHQRHIGDDVDHLAVDRGGLAGEVVMQRPAGGREAEHDRDHDAGDQR